MSEGPLQDKLATDKPISLGKESQAQVDAFTTQIKDLQVRHTPEPCTLDRQSPPTPQPCTPNPQP